MARIRQQYPGNYKTSANISVEFENLYRYLASGEFGDKTLAEILSGFVDAEGNFSGPIEFRYDGTEGLSYRVGQYASDTEGWEQVASALDLRGADGAAVGDITLSPFTEPFVTTSTSGQTNFDFAFDAADSLLVFRSGTLLREPTDYTKNATGGANGTGRVTFPSGQTAGLVFQFFRIRNTPSINFSRQDTITVASQATFPYNAGLIGQNIFVYRNGILQREGGSADYTRQDSSNTVTFNSAIPAANTVTVVGFLAPTGYSIPGLMRSASFVNPSTGLIRFDRLSIADNEIPNSKVNGLSPLITSAARIHVGATAPASPATTRLWVDTSTNPSSLKAWDGAVWITTSVANIVPTFSSTEANLYLKVNALGTAATWSNIDFSSLVPRTFMGAANGVAQLDAAGRLPTSQFPATLPFQTLYNFFDGSISGTTYNIVRLFGQRVRITAVRASLVSGTATGQISVSGVAVGPTFSLSASPVEQVLATQIEIDARASSRSISFAITSPSSANGLEVALACQLVL